ncbi:MAG TPA: sialidase family protein [Dongiaceae bacterium]|nr:sialidase family protein [Dongiaceae bacterium]
MTSRKLAAVACAALLGFSLTSFAQPAPDKPKPDAQFGNWLFKTPDPKIWKRTEQNGNLVFAVDEPAGDFCTLTLFADAPAGADFAQQFDTAVAADQKAKDTVKIEADTGAKPGKATEGFDVLTRSLRAETSALHTFHLYIAGHSGAQFNLAAFQTTSEESWKQYGAQASQFLLSLKLANSLLPDEVAKLVGKTAAAPPPSLPGFDTPAPATTQPEPPPAAPAAPAAAQAATAVPDVPLAKSAIVVKDTVTQKNGKPVNGIKLSQHDMDIGSPCLAVGPDGVIHVAFVEQHRTTYAYAVYYRSSSDGGKTWTAAKNLSEDLAGIRAGHCTLMVDGRNRVYVVWRSALKETFPAGMDPWAGAMCYNLMCRVLENGRWSKIFPVHPPGSPETQDDGSMSFFGVTDAAGRAQVVWNARPDKWHPELTRISGTFHQHLPGIGNGLVFQATLDGTTPPTPREIFLAPVSGQNGGAYSASCDGFDTLNGYVDSTGAPHFVAAVSRTRDDSLRNKSWYELVENGKTGPMLGLPELSFHAWRDIPTLLVDAAGRRHVITMYLAGEQPSIRDYLIGTDDEPTVIRAASGPKGTVDGLQACQGPGGRMVVIMEMNDTGERGSGETYISTSTGNGWTPPVNVTNNAGRRSYASKQTSSESNVAVEKSYYPGPGTAAYDRDGHLLLLMINNEFSLFSNTAFGVELAGGNSSQPVLQFLRF